jgi:acyl-CoA reductase-like NAD-dependent aldehyde dehydrogenase
MSPRLAVRKTYKLYVGGAFARSESGRHDPVLDHEGSHVANITRASRKDVRDAVKKARGAQGGWAGKTAYNRGQVLYRAAEALEQRGEEFAQHAVSLRGAKPAAARDEVAAAVDVLVHYAGWTDKLHAVLGGVNPVAAPFLSFSTPEPTGVVGVVAPDEPPLAGLVSRVAPAIVGGNATVVLASETSPLAAVELGEVLATSDVPGGVVNILTGNRDELAPVLAGHMDVNALDVGGADGQIEELERLAADNVKRVVRGRPDAESPWEIASFLELKTVWHPIGL